MKICRIWKQYEVDAVKFAVDRGHSLHEVSIILGRTVKSISAYIRDNGFEKVKSDNDYFKNLKFGGEYMSNIDYKDLLSMADSGMSYPVIAKELGLSVGTVSSRLNRARNKADCSEKASSTGLYGYPFMTSKDFFGSNRKQSKRSGEPRY